jgi:hypothetical protein
MNPLTADLDHVLAHTQGLWEELRGQTVFITDGTGNQDDCRHLFRQAVARMCLPRRTGLTKMKHGKEFFSEVKEQFIQTKPHV